MRERIPARILGMYTSKKVMTSRTATTAPDTKRVTLMKDASTGRGNRIRKAFACT